MMTLAALIVFACLLLAATSLVQLLATRKRLVNRLSGLAPGAITTEHQGRAKRIKNLSKANSSKIDSELADLLEMLIAVLLAGESLFAAIQRLTKISSCYTAEQFKVLLERVQLGGDITTELSALCQRIPTDSMREFCNKLSLAIARGTPLANSLRSLATSLRSKNANSLLAKAGANETKMLIPVVLLICPVTIIFALYPSTQFLTLGFI